MKIVCIGWKMTREETETLNNTAGYLRKELPETEIICVDGYRHTIEDGDEYICFGEESDSEAHPGNTWKMPKVKDLSKERETSMKSLKYIILELQLVLKSTPKTQNTHVETQDGTSIGKEACDINVTEKEAQYLKTLKAMLDGSTMVITKGDIRIEVQ